MNYRIALLSRPTRNDLEDINALLPQIASRPHLLAKGELARIVSQESCHIVVAREHIGSERRIVGMATLTAVAIPTGLVAVVEDVVVDERFRGAGIGKVLVRELIRIARRMRAKHVSLTANPARRAANALYEKIGFSKKETNYYRINLYLPAPAARWRLEKLLAKRSALFKKHDKR